MKLVTYDEGKVGRIEHIAHRDETFAVQIAFDAQSRKFIGNHANRPSGSVALRRWPTIRIRTVCLDFGRSLGFIPVTKGAETTLDFHVFANEISRALRPVR